MFARDHLLKPYGTRQRARQFTQLHWAWLYLIVAILSEVLGLTVMRIATDHGSILGHFVLYVLIAFSYVLLSKAVRSISVGVAYAIWEGSGIALITFVSWLVFAHQLSLREVLGLILAIVGIVLVNAGQTNPSSHSLALSVPEEA